ncbi:hypothetical protein MLD38_007760 [Melastoma candidum]|uniref:Uncharacterized protein n=1 Tax=Melastoma candidum TaxID=119954 RepID=A0ACB9RSN0_9MYRT|nr:hypothetical protein MLD38_007760 [Melastoma candidum]
MCHNVGDAEFRHRRTRAAIMGLAREIAELNEALRGITEMEDEPRRFGSRVTRLWLRTRRLKLRRELLLGAAAASFVWSAAIVCLVTMGRMEIAGPKDQSGFTFSNLDYCDSVSSRQ